MSTLEIYGKSPYANPSKTMHNPMTGETLPLLGELLPGNQIELTFSEGKIVIKAMKKKPNKPLEYTVSFGGEILGKSEIPDFSAKGVVMSEFQGSSSIFSGMSVPLIQFLIYCKF